MFYFYYVELAVIEYFHYRFKIQIDETYLPDNLSQYAMIYTTKFSEVNLMFRFGSWTYRIEQTKISSSIM